MIGVHHLAEEMLAAYRALLGSVDPPYLIVPGAVEPTVAADLRARLAAAGTEPYDLADRGRYRWNGALCIDELWSALAAFASGLLGMPLAVRGARWLHLARGDYALVKDDVRTRPPSAAPLVELSLDLSATFTGEADQVFAVPLGPGTERAIVIPQMPGLLAVVPRPPHMTRYDRPLTLRAGGAEVVRLRVWLSPRDAAGEAPPPAR